MKYDLLCYAKELNNDIYVDFYLVKYRTRLGSNKPIAFEVVSEGHSFEELAQIDAKVIGKKTLLTCLDSMFKCTFELPRLNYKNLVDNFNQKLKETYGEMVKDYDYSILQKTSADSGFIFDVIYFKVQPYKELLMSFARCGILFDEAYYFPQILSYLVKEDINNCLGIFYNFNRIEIFFVNNDYYKYLMADPLKNDQKTIDDYLKSLLVNDLNEHFFNDERIEKIENLYTNFEPERFRKIAALTSAEIEYRTLSGHYEIYPFIQADKLIELPVEI